MKMYNIKKFLIMSFLIGLHASLLGMVGQNRRTVRRPSSIVLGDKPPVAPKPEAIQRATVRRQQEVAFADRPQVRTFSSDSVISKSQPSANSSSSIVQGDKPPVAPKPVSVRRTIRKFNETIRNKGDLINGSQNSTSDSVISEPQSSVKPPTVIQPTRQGTVASLASRFNQNQKQELVSQSRSVPTQNDAPSEESVTLKPDELSEIKTIQDDSQSFNKAFNEYKTLVANDPSNITALNNAFKKIEDAGDLLQVGILGKSKIKLKDGQKLSKAVNPGKIVDLIEKIKGVHNEHISAIESQNRVAPTTTSVVSPTTAATKPISIGKKITNAIASGVKKVRNILPGSKAKVQPRIVYDFTNNESSVKSAVSENVNDGYLEVGAGDSKSSSVAQSTLRIPPLRPPLPPGYGSSAQSNVAKAASAPKDMNGVGDGEDVGYIEVKPDTPESDATKQQIVPIPKRTVTQRLAPGRKAPLPPSAQSKVVGQAAVSEAVKNENMNGVEDDNGYIEVEADTPESYATQQPQSQKVATVNIPPPPPLPGALLGVGAVPPPPPPLPPNLNNTRIPTAPADNPAPKPAPSLAKFGAPEGAQNRGALLAQIQAGKNLKPAEQRQLAPKKVNAGQGSMMESLNKRLKSMRGFIEPGDSNA